MSTELRAIVVDDEPIARQILEDYIARTPDLQSVGACANALDAFGLLPRAAANLLFLDINLPEISGLQFLRALSNPPAVIFTTAYAEHAVESYELNAVDYLLKPVSYERFCRAVEKARVALAPAIPSSTPVSSEPHPDLFLKSDGRLIRVAHLDVLYVEALKDYVRYHTTGGALVVHATMKSTEESLAGLTAFVRVHKSYIVNLRHVREIGSGWLHIKTQSIPIGATYREGLERALAELQRP
jgi:DNA-binding LytR/AlgR family response regulator